MEDILIYDFGNGGEISLKNGDIEGTGAIFNMVYLAHFGGNIEASTTGNEDEGEERSDWWGNFYLEEKAMMNSELERALNNNPLTSSGRASIERAAKKDLEFLSDIADVDVSVQITGNNKIKITEKINQTIINFIWDSTKNEIIETIII